MQKLSIVLLLTALGRLTFAAKLGHDSTASQRGASDSPGFLTKLPRDLDFSCDGRLSGFYADPVYECQVFHICLNDRKKGSMLCPAGTSFKQEFFTCTWARDSNCENAVSNYGLNSRLYNQDSADSSPEPVRRRPAPRPRPETSPPASVPPRQAILPPSLSRRPQPQPEAPPVLRQPFPSPPNTDFDGISDYLPPTNDYLPPVNDYIPPDTDYLPPSGK